MIVSHVFYCPPNQPNLSLSLRPSLSASSVFARIKAPLTPPLTRSSIRSRSYSVDQTAAVGQVLKSLNDKTVIVCDRRLRTHGGYPNLAQVKLVRDEPLYDQNGQVTHLLFVLDQPLIDWDSGEILPVRDQGTRLFYPLPTVYNALGPSLNTLVRHFCATADSEDLEDQKRQLTGLLAKGHQLLDTIYCPQLSQEQVYSMFENFVMEQTYDVLFFKITQQELSEDVTLSEAIDSMFQLDFIQVGLPPILGAKKRVSQAIAEFERIGSYRTPADKLDSLLTTVSRLTDGIMADVQQGLDSDSLIPLMLLTIIRSRAPHLRANLNYMKDYSFERNIITGPYGYALITLESVLDYIIDAHRPLAEIANENQCFWTALDQGNLDRVKGICQRSSPTPSRQTSSSSLSRSLLIRDTIYEARDHKGNNALLMACRGGHVLTVEYILSVRESINPQDKNDSQQTPLMLALEAQSIDTVRLLLKDPFVLATIDHVSDTQDTGLSMASRIQDPVFVELMVASGASLDQPAITQAIYAACLANSSRVIGYLLSFNPSLDLLNDRGENFYHVCGDPVHVQACIDGGIKGVDAMDNEKKTPLLGWAAKGRPDMVEVLARVANTDRLDSQGRSVLHLLSMVQWKTNGAWPGIQALVKSLGHLAHLAEWSKGNMALHLAAQTMNSRPEAWVTELVRQGGDLTRVNRFWDRPLNLWRGTDRSCLQALCLENRPVRKHPDYGAIAVTHAWKEVVDGKQELFFAIQTGKPGDMESMRTVHRQLDDFVFLRQQLLDEWPDAVVPTLDHLIEPLLLLSPKLLEDAVQCLDRMLAWLFFHPLLRHIHIFHAFVRLSDLKRDVIAHHAFMRRQLRSENGESSVQEKGEDYFFKYARQMILPLRDSLGKMLHASRQVELCIRGTEDSRRAIANDLKTMSLGQPELREMLNVISMSCNCMYSPWIDFIGVVQSMHCLANGVLLALEYPLCLINQQTQLRTHLERQREALQHRKAWTLFSQENRHFNQEKTKVVETLGAVEKTSCEIGDSHQRISDELAHFQTIQPRQISRAISRLTRQQFEREKMNLKVLMMAMSELKNTYKEGTKKREL
ncbi:hypothetical protein CLU79DRAFT_724548 [Phycomyces nitens]|nr:hypothetical protein CLU79DRAFT_724548 [Phycomyces nitens]